MDSDKKEKEAASWPLWVCLSFPVAIPAVSILLTWLALQLQHNVMPRLTEHFSQHLTEEVAQAFSLTKGGEVGK